MNLHDLTKDLADQEIEFRAINLDNDKKSIVLTLMAYDVKNFAIADEILKVHAKQYISIGYSIVIKS